MKVRIEILLRGSICIYKLNIRGSALSKVKINVAMKTFVFFWGGVSIEILKFARDSAVL